MAKKVLTTEQRLRMLETPKAPVDLVIDTDAYNEIDDQFAIAYALCAPERVRLLALCAAPFTNARSTGPADGMEKSYQEILHLLSLTGDKVPAYRGSTRYLPDEQTPVSSQAAEKLVRLAMEHTPEAPLYVAAIGAITNVASALLMEPGIADRMVVVWLGGHVLDWPDNREFNAQQDVAADRVVFGSGVPLVILPCQGVVSAFTTTGPELDYWLRGKNSLCDYLVKQTVEEVDTYAKGKVWSRVIWDVTTVAWIMNWEGKFMADKLIPTPIPQYDHHYSMDSRRPFCRYVYSIRRDPLFADLFSRLAKA